MNTKVTVTGMEVTTKVNNNLLIAQTTTSATTALTDGDFKTSDVDSISGILEPVSTINGSSFFYAKNNNVGGTGAAVSTSYVAYAENDEFDANYGFNTASVQECYGFKDYAFVLKATNTDSSNPAYINVTAADLVYGGTQTVNEYAFRIAIFVEDIGTSLAATSGNVGTLKTILKPGSAHYFSYASESAEKAVSTTSAKAAIPTLGTAANIASVAAGTTYYYKVVVRLWLEGEDTTCNNTIFATLNEAWALNLTIQLQNATGGVSALATSVTSTKINLSSDSASATTLVVDGTTYYQLTTNTTYYTLSSTLTSTSRVFQMEDGHPIEVTNQCTLPSGS